MRNRLTAKTLLAESQADGLFPGDVGNMERKKFYHDIDEYNNDASELKPGWDTKDETDTWSPSNKRGPANIGIMKAAAQYRTAKKALVMAEMFLGEKAPEEQIKDQAKEFMGLGYRGICASIRRWAATEPAEEKKEDTPVEEKKDEKPVNTPEGQACPECGNDPCTCEGGENTGVEDIEQQEGGEGGEPDMIIDLPDQEKTEGEPTDLGDGSIQDVAADPVLQDLFNESIGNEDGEKKPATEEAPATQTVEKPVSNCAAAKQTKAGIKHLAGQPRLASSTKSGIEELASCWTGLTVNNL